MKPKLRNVFASIVVAMVFLNFSGFSPGLGAQQPVGKSNAATLDQLRQEAQGLKQQVDDVNAANAKLEGQLRDVERDIEYWGPPAFLLQRIAPFLISLTGVGLIPSIGFFFAAIALMMLVLRYPVAARRLLDISFVRRLPVQRRPDDTAPFPRKGQIAWVVFAVFLILLLALPAFSQPSSLADSSDKLELKSIGIQDLLDLGQAKLADDRLTEKQQDGSPNSLECFEAVLEKDPGNAEARGGMQKVVGRLVELAGLSPNNDGAKYMDRAQAIVTAYKSLGLVLSATMKEAMPETTAEEDAPSASAITGSQQTSQSVGEQLGTALQYLEMGPLERVIELLQVIPEGHEVFVTLPDDAAEEFRRRAGKLGQSMIADFAQGTPIGFEVVRDSPMHYVWLASLHEAVGRQQELKRALASAVDTYDRLSPRIETTLAIATSLEELGEKQTLSTLVAKAVGKSSNALQIESIIKVAIDAGLQPSAIEALNQAIIRFSSNRDEALPLVLLLHSLGAKSEAETLLNELVAVASYGQAFHILKWTTESGVNSLIAPASARALTMADFSESLEVAKWAQVNKQPEILKDALARAAGRMTSPDDANELIATSENLGAMKSLAEDLSKVLASNFSIAQWRVWGPLPDGLDVRGYKKDTEEEGTALSSLIGLWLMGAADKSELRNLFEAPLKTPLKEVIDSMGGQPFVPVNDVAALAAYYSASADPAVEAASKMVIIQRQLRGWDQGAAVPSSEEAARWALQMEIDGQKHQLADAKSQGSSLESDLKNRRQDLWEARKLVFGSIANLIAKALLLLIGLRIALLRSIAAAKAALDFRFARFSWTFLETIGFELCCTLVMAPVGFFMTLLAQDRLKHFGIGDKIVSNSGLANPSASEETRGA